MQSPDGKTYCIGKGIPAKVVDTRSGEPDEGEIQWTSQNCQAGSPLAVTIKAADEVRTRFFEFFGQLQDDRGLLVRGGPFGWGRKRASSPHQVHSRNFMFPSRPPSGGSCWCMPLQTIHHQLGFGCLLTRLSRLASPVLSPVSALLSGLGDLHLKKISDAMSPCPLQDPYTPRFYLLVSLV